MAVILLTAFIHGDTSPRRTPRGRLGLLPRVRNLRLREARALHWDLTVGGDERA